MAQFQKSFEGEEGFCWNCGSILPTLGESGSVKCFMCKSEFGPEAFGAMESHYEINFNSPRDFSKGYFQRDPNMANKNSGPTVDRKCIKCGFDKMSYATLQLRSADEGQTVFYTCLKCGFKEVENS